MNLRRFIAIILSVIPLFSLAGPVDTLTTFYNEQWVTIPKGTAYSFYRKAWKNDQLWYVRDYYNTGQMQMSATYSDDSLKVAEGEIRWYHKNGQLSKQAVYINDAAEGTVQSWHENGQLSGISIYRSGRAEGLSKSWYKNAQLADSTYYRADQLHGAQVWYHENGQKSEEGQYQYGKPASVQLWTPDGAVDAHGTPNELMPEFRKLSGKGLSEYLAAKLQYPKKSRARNVEGRTVIQFSIDEQGRISDCTVKKSSGDYGLDMEALRVICAMPHWQPGKSHNRLVKVSYTLPITFKLD